MDFFSMGIVNRHSETEIDEKKVRTVAIELITITNGRNSMLTTSRQNIGYAQQQLIEKHGDYPSVKLGILVGTLRITETKTEFQESTDEINKYFEIDIGVYD